MEGASAAAIRLPPPPWRLPSRKLSFLAPPATSYLSLSLLTIATATTTGGRVLPVSVRAEPPEAGNAQEEPSTPAAPPPQSPPPPKKPAAKGAGAGFGGVAESKKKRGKQKGSVIRRDPIQKPSSLYSREGGSGGGPAAEKPQQTVNESAFLLTWLGLGFLILVEGVALAASGFLPEEWDRFFVKYLYPSFTPTVFLFVGGTVAYGVLKYLRGEKLKS